jgi:RNA polymerase sigma-70 factor (ECF subfamily)
MTQTEFLNIVMPFKDKVFRLAKRLLVSTEEAEDATQEVLMKLWNNKAKIEEYKNVEAFSMTMTKNFCFDKLKSKQAQNLKIVHNNYEDKHTPLQKQIELNDSVNWVARIIEELPEQQKLIIQLRDIEEYDLDEIAKMLDMNNTAVRVTLSRARKTIREKLTNTHNYGIK